MSIRDAIILLTWVKYFADLLLTTFGILALAKYLLTSQTPKINHQA